MTVGHPHPPEKALIDQGIDPNECRCQFHARTHVNENSRRACDIAMPAVTRYDAISRIGRRSVKPETATYDWDGMSGSGRNLYGNPDQCIDIIHNAMRHYYFNILTTTFNFGGIQREEIKKSMRLFAKEVMPAFR
jgi:alkanesulfonate monooxygenase SsuD/methylene tetrahydromethanopterin reductase-like flavin-dependent oxidoreductase (luciferase family)